MKNPTKEFLALEAAAIAAGFRLENTGGGCMAWEKFGKSSYIMITEVGEPGEGESLNQPFTMGVYFTDAEGSCTDEWATADFQNFEAAARQGDILLHLIEEMQGTKTQAVMVLRNAPDGTNFCSEGVLLLGQLQHEYTEWCKANGHSEEGCAEELLHSLIGDDSKKADCDWLKLFIQRWEAHS